MIRPSPEGAAECAMIAIQEILGLCPQAQDRIRRAADKLPILSPLNDTTSTEALNYESSVFNYLLDNKDALGISKLFKLKNQRMDGEIELNTGGIVAFEIKYRMNWLKACQSGYQFRQYLRHRESSAGPLQGGIVFFEEFSGDWDRTFGNRPRKLGWDGWYLTHHKIDEFPFQLVRLREGTMQTYS